MLNKVPLLLSAEVSGEFAAFKDPSVTTNQIVYYIPSKTAVIGLIGAIIGVDRSHGVSERYSTEYLELFSRTRIGIELLSKPNKVSFFTNHRSLKEPKTKPFKTELAVRPQYRIFVSSDDETITKIQTAISSGRYAYPPYLGHAYCPATISRPMLHKVSEHETHNFRTSSVILDEYENYNASFQMEIEIESKQQRGKGSTSSSSPSIIIERHLHHFVEEGELKARVLKHWIPTEGTTLEVEMDGAKLSSLARLDGGKIVCLY